MSSRSSSSPLLPSLPPSALTLSQASQSLLLSTSAHLSSRNYFVSYNLCIRWYANISSYLFLACILSFCLLSCLLPYYRSRSSVTSPSQRHPLTILPSRHNVHRLTRRLHRLTRRLHRLTLPSSQYIISLDSHHRRSDTSFPSLHEPSISAVTLLKTSNIRFRHRRKSPSHKSCVCCNFALTVSFFCSSLALQA